jgi:hypothetical protein
MKHWLVKHYQIFVKHPDWYFFYTFLITFPLSVRKIIHFYPIAGQYNEFTAISLYLSDILLIITIAVWLFILGNNLSFLSIVKCFKQAIKMPLIYLPLFLLLISWFSIFWSYNLTLAIYKSIKLTGFIFLYFYVIYQTVSLKNSSSVKQSLSRETFIINTFWIIFVLAFISAIIGIIQVGLQHSIGLFLLKESYVSQSTSGVAKFILLGKTYIRPYSIFPHPNIFGGFLLMAIFFGFYIRKMLTANNNKYKCSTWNILDFTRLNNFNEKYESGKKSNHSLNCPTMAINLKSNKILNQVQDDKLNIFRRTYIFAWNFIQLNIFNIILITLMISLILTFSKSAWLGIIIALGYVYHNKNCSTWNNFNTIQVRNIFLWNGTFLALLKRWVKYNNSYLICIAIVILALIGYILINSIFPLLNLSQSYNERLIYLKPAFKIISTYPLFGLGNGQFVPRMEHFSTISLQPWQFQPVHNVFLLVWSELGFIGLLALIQILVVIFQGHCFTSQNNVPRSAQDKQVKCFNKNRLVHSDNSFNDCSVNCSTWNNFSRVEHPTKNVSSLKSFILNYALNNYLKGILLAFIVIMLFDHYFWDIQQGQIMLWLLLGLIAGVNSQINSLKGNNSQLP